VLTELAYFSASFTRGRVASTLVSITQISLPVASRRSKDSRVPSGDQAGMMHGPGRTPTAPERRCLAAQGEQDARVVEGEVAAQRDYRLRIGGEEDSPSPLPVRASGPGGAGHRGRSPGGGK